MSDFTCQVVRVEIIPHPNAEFIEIAKVGDFQSIVKKGQFESGDLAVYIPEQAVLPEWLLRNLGFWDEAKGKGALAGAGNRVRAIKLRGVLSQGLALSGIDWDEEVGPTTSDELRLVIGEDGSNDIFEKGENVAEFLGVIKYEPALPSHMAGKCIGLDMSITHNYDFDNLKKNPSMFDDGEDVVITEKIHGTLLQIIAVPKSKANERYYKGRVAITSKGLGGKGIILDHTDETNLYAQAVVKHGLLDKMFKISEGMDALDFAGLPDQPTVLFGEVFGRTAGGAGVQDMTYNDQTLDFRAFDIANGVREKAEFANEKDFAELMDLLKIYRAPVLYRGPYSKQIVLSHTDGKTTLVGPRGSKPHIREGVVVKSATEARSPGCGRKIAKSVSEAYLLRKTVNATEFS